MSTLSTWDKISGALGSTNTSFGGNWGNLISDFFNGVNIALTDPTKVPRINTLTRFKFEKLGLFDGDESHDVLFSVDDIDTGPTRKIKIRRMNNPFEEDYMLFEGLPAAILNKEIDSDLNTITNITNADIKVDAGITDSKLAQITDKSKQHSQTAYKDAAQTFTSKQTIQNSNLDQMKFYRPINTSGSNLLQFDLQNDSSNQKQYGTIGFRSEIVDASSERGSFLIALTEAGDITTEQFRIINGQYYLGKSSGFRAIIDANSITTSNKTWTIPNFTDTFVGTTATQKLENKNFDSFVMNRIAAPSDPAADKSILYVKQIDSNNDGVFYKIKKNGAFVEGQIV